MGNVCEYVSQFIVEAVTSQVQMSLIGILTKYANDFNFKLVTSNQLLSEKEKIILFYRKL